MATSVKLLLKLIQDQNEACTKSFDDRKAQRIAGMVNIIDDVKSRVEKFQSSGKRELRRCNTDLKPNVPKDSKSPHDPVSSDDKEKLRKELNASFIARKSLQVMCSSLGKEKEIMASELAKKVQELNEMEELINDLKTQNENLLSKLQTFNATDHKCKRCESQGNNNVALQKRNKEISEQLLKSLDSYRYIKRKLRDANEDNSRILSTMEEIGVEVQGGLNHIHSLRETLIVTNNEKQVDKINEEISTLDHHFECLKLNISKHVENKGRY